MVFASSAVERLIVVVVIMSGFIIMKVLALMKYRSSEYLVFLLPSLGLRGMESSS